MFQVLNFVRVAVQSRKVNLMSIDEKAASSNTFTLPIDSKLQEVTISVSGQNPRITLIDPSGWCKNSNCCQYRLTFGTLKKKSQQEVHNFFIQNI